VKYIMFTDGAAAPSNPGPSGCGIVCYTDNPRKEIFRLSQYLGRGTNNFAEYMSLIIGLETALEYGIKEIDVYMDSQLVVKQCNLEWRVKEPSLVPLHAKVSELKQQFDRIGIFWVSRDKNTVADSLSKQALKEKLY
jgi:ribonuclease HI